MKKISQEIPTAKITNNNDDEEEGNSCLCLRVPLLEAAILAKGYFAGSAYDPSHLPLTILPAHLTAAIFPTRNYLLMV